MRKIEETVQFSDRDFAAVAVGKFDGIHRGHRLLIDRIVREKNNGLHPVVISVDDVIKKDCILLPDEAERYLKSLGVEYVIRLPLDRRFRNLSAESFILDYLVSLFHTRFIAAGSDFTFGKDRSGDVTVLASAGTRYGFRTEIFEKLAVDGNVIGSALIRTFISDGRMEEAEQMLGYPYEISAEVIHGKALGRALGFPTINLAFPALKVRPKEGVYLVRVKIGERKYRGIADFGVSPTVSADPTPSLEIHLLDTSDDYYGQSVTVSFLSFLREEIRFDSLEALKKRVLSDVEEAKKRIF